ncbi:MAG TPA: alpha/beta hydrolase [Acidimicrobiia bacterium]|nr:alpha/beta hydrolase [Acidimicrobiia bacterium]
MLLHGSPGSRLFRPPPELVDELGVRVVTYDRPGYGRSDPQPDRRVADAAGDVRALLDHLDVERAALIGWSGGGPFAVATARHLSERVAHLAIVSAPGPLDEVPTAWEALGDYQRPTAEMARQDPTRSKRAIGRHMEPYLENPVLFLGGRGKGPDGETVRGPANAMLVEQVNEALVQGAEGIAADLVAMWLDWGFRLAEVAVPTTVFQGAHDRHNHDDARCYASNIPDATLVVWPDAGHLGVVSEWRTVLA